MEVHSNPPVAKQSKEEGVPGGVVPTDLSFQPDSDFCAHTLISLSTGITAYRLDDPPCDAQANHIPLVVCLHDLTNSSYMFKDISKLLTNNRTGPPARVLVMDFFGRGRSPYTKSTTCNMDLFVMQLHELLERIGILEDKMPIIIVGQGLGASVGAGFAAKFPVLVYSMCVIAPLGVQWASGALSFLPEGLPLSIPFVGKYLWYAKMRRTLATAHEKLSFYCSTENTPYYYLVKKDHDMIQWQMKFTPGYLQALRSTLEHFPLHNEQLIDMYSAMGYHPTRQLCLLWGEEDQVSNCTECMSRMEQCFSQTARQVRVPGTGRYPLVENFNAAADAILSFCKESAKNMRLDTLGH